MGITSPHVSPSGTSLQMNVYDSSGALDAGTAYITSNPTELDFTPTAAQAGTTTTVVISPTTSRPLEASSCPVPAAPVLRSRS